MKLGYGQGLQKAAPVEVIVERAKADPKCHIWLGAYAVLVFIVDMYGYSDYRQWVKAKALFDDEGDDALKFFTST